MLPDESTVRALLNPHNEKETKMPLDMPFTTFVRKPFVVQAVEVTVDNIAEIAPHVGSLEQKEDGTPYIQVDPKKVEKIWRVYPGFFLTQMGSKLRCYSRKAFTGGFTEATPELMEWVSYVNGPKEENNETVEVEAEPSVVESEED